MRIPFSSMALGGVLALGAATAQADDHPYWHNSRAGVTYNVTITNVTRGTNFTPFLIASHRPAQGLLFSPGEAASPEFAALAEGGATGPLQGVLDADPRVGQTNTSGGLLMPGDSVTVQIKARPGRDRISLAAMLLPTNDGVVSAQNLRLPWGKRPHSVYALGYDAGSEPNDELCVSIPGPTCGGAGGSPGSSGEGYVHVHAGIHGIGDLNAADYDWRNPVARITIQRQH